MCGIAGHLCFGMPPGPLDPMLDRLAHRGPDDQGVYDGDVVRLGFRRLAIVDLSPAGHQPMTNEDGSIWFIFNGEIYNYQALRTELLALGHRFRSHTDTETVIHSYEQWGTACLQRLNGMFAFALWDARRRRLFCARDRFGVKPLYFAGAPTGKGLVFASEIKALLGHPAAPPPAANQQALYDFLVAGLLDHTDETCFAGIRQLPAAHYLLADADGLAAHRYWDLPDPKCAATIEPSPVRRQRWADEFAALLEDSVRLRLHADVPVGTCLSGGLDSSAIVCLANRILFDGADSLPWHRRGERQKTFSACYEDRRHDERPFIDEVLRLTGAQATCTFPGKETPLPDLIPAVVWHQDEPFASTSILAQWHVMRAAARAGVTVLLDGQGADELLGGYHGYFGAALADDLLAGRAGQLARDLLLYRRYHAPGWSLITRSSLSGLLAPNAPAWRAIRALPPVRAHATGWLAHEFAAKHAVSDTWIPRRTGRLGALLYNQALHSSLPALLHYEDRNSMAFSLEARTPFLDYRLAEFVARLPNAAHVHNGVTKVVLRQGMRGILPDAVAHRRDKKGFSTPEDTWFRGDLREWAREILESSSLAQRGYVDSGAVRASLARHVAGKAHESTLIWRVINVELWARMFLDQPLAAPREAPSVRAPRHVPAPAGR